jgi:AcrR family transcriptional regulator
MNDRKQHVMDQAHQLFIEKGFQNTSIQEILDYSGISKGTFYNYFSSKNELIMDIFKSTFSKMEKERSNLLNGQDRSDPAIFMKQVQLQMKINREYKLIPLFEEVYFSHDEELKQFLEIGQVKTLRWVYERLCDIFDESKHPYLLDAAVLLKGILQQGVRYYVKANGPEASIDTVIKYSVRRVLKIVEELAAADEQLLTPKVLDEWLPNKGIDQAFKKELNKAISVLKNSHSQCPAINEKLTFIQDELLNSKSPRKFLVDSVILTLTARDHIELMNLQELVEGFFSGEKSK